MDVVHVLFAESVVDVLRLKRQAPTAFMTLCPDHLSFVMVAEGAAGETLGKQQTPCVCSSFCDVLRFSAPPGLTCMAWNSLAFVAVSNDEVCARTLLFQGHA
jgi:hypothetical protein